MSLEISVFSCHLCPSSHPCVLLRNEEYRTNQPLISQRSPDEHSFKPCWIKHVILISDIFRWKKNRSEVDLNKDLFLKCSFGLTAWFCEVFVSTHILPRLFTSPVFVAIKQVMALITHHSVVISSRDKLMSTFVSSGLLIYIQHSELILSAHSSSAYQRWMYCFSRIWKSLKKKETFFGDDLILCIWCHPMWVISSLSVFC